METMTTNFREYLLDEIKTRNMSASEFARFIGVSPATITRAIDERNPSTPGLDFLLKLSKSMKVSLATLIELAYPEAAAEVQITPSAKALAERIQRLPPNVQETIAAIIKGSDVD